MPRQYSYGKRPYVNNNYKPNNNRPWSKPFNAAPIRPSDLFGRGALKGAAGVNAADSVSDDVRSYFDQYQSQNGMYDWFNKKEIEYMQRVYNYQKNPPRNIFQRIHRGLEKTSYSMYEWLRKNVLGNSTSDLVNNVKKYGIDAAKMFFDVYSAGGLTAAEASMNLINDAASRWGPDVLQKYGITNVSGKDINQLMYGLERMYSDHNMKINSGSNGKPVVTPITPTGPVNTGPSVPVVPDVNAKLNVEQSMANPNNKDPDVVGLPTS